ncbi:YehS family protein [Mangrovivirga cuniculi]|uniref:DUF1456 domain-containing protein n=1 Tax=Mangrovivirga cuniculi TaxID=2715131 RepID=A0A4D7K4N4_9BACT|nr:DUF1456 family protein [Mangrovivirga cuniculi]QCK15794.1 DUF1456 domain-containing protein [Mangrovivirga cuniculi]
MTNNDILRRLRYTFDLNDHQVIEIFELAQYSVNRSEVVNWMLKEEDEYFQPMSDKELALFLNGLINLKRGVKDGPQHEAEDFLNNNLILRKLRIALNLKDTDMLEILNLANFSIGKHELSAFFRKPGQGQYKPAGDQVLRKFLKGLQLKYRG